MSNVHIKTFKKVLEKFEPEELDPEIFEVLIRNLASWYNAKKQGRIELAEGEFHSRFVFEVFQIAEVLDLFTAKNYRSALGMYFGNRAARKHLGNYKKEAKNTAPMPKVGMLQGVSRDRVSVQTTPMVVIKFSALKENGTLMWPEVTVAERLYYGRPDEKIPDEIFWKAKRQALAAMNSRRIGE